MTTTLPLADLPSEVSYIQHRFDAYPRQIRIETSSACNMHCLMCLPAGELVMTSKGMRTVEAIREGDFLFTHNGRYRRVMQVMTHDVGEEITVLKPAGLPPLRFTHEHPVLTPDGWADSSRLKEGDSVVIPLPESRNVDVLDLADENVEPNSRVVRTYTPPDMVEQAQRLLSSGASKAAVSRVSGLSRATVGRIQGGLIPGESVIAQRVLCDEEHAWIGGAKHKVRRLVTVTDELLFVLGLYLAEGHVSIDKNRVNSGAVFLSFGRHEEVLIAQSRRVLEDAFGLVVRTRLVRTAKRVELSSGLLARVFSGWFGTGAVNKRVPTWIMQLPRARLWRFLMGYVAGDGCYVKRTGWKVATISLTAALQMKQIAYLCGGKAWISKSRARTGVIEGRTVNCRPVYDVRFNKVLNSAPVGDGPSSHFVPVSVSHEFYKGKVYNFEVEEDNSYVSGLVAVHNCMGHGGRNVLTPESKKMTRPMERLDQGLFEHIVKDIASWPVPLRELAATNYGEWFMHPRWWEQAQMIDRLLPKTRLVVVTTGVLVTDDVLLKLAQIKTLKYVNVSVNAFFKETYERVHGVPATHLPRIRAWVERFRRMRADVHLQVSMAYDPIMHGQSEIERDLFKSYWQPIVNEVSVNTTSYASHPTHKPRFPIHTSCRSVFDGLVVFADGRVGSGCCFDADAELAVGKVPGQKLLDIWKGDKLRDLGRLHNAGKRNDIGLCAGCSFA